MHAGQQYCAGWIVAPGRWYKLRQQSERGYELLPDEARAATLCSPRHTAACMSHTCTELLPPCDCRCCSWSTT